MRNTMRDVRYWRGLAAAVWLTSGVALFRPSISSFCGVGFSSCSLELYGLSMFTWVAFGCAGGLMWHYWQKSV